MWGTIVSYFSKKKETKVDYMKNEKDEAKNEFIKRVTLHEGLRLKPYRCTAGKLSIGIGRNLDDVGISEDEANYLLNNDIKRAEKDLLDTFPWASKISPRRYYVLVEMVFNLGLGRFKQFKNMLIACEKGDWGEASKQALDSLWAKQVGKRAETLTKVLREG